MTGRDLITASLRLIGALAPGESLAASEATDGLASINRMIDAWSNEGLMVYGITPETPLTLTPGDGTVTLGTAGDITTRPMSIEKAVLRDGTTDYPIKLLTLDEYTRITNKSLQSAFPYELYDDSGYPQRTLYLYPVPSAAKQLVLWTKRALSQIAIDTTFSLPPGYELALVYNAAILLAPEYGRSSPPEVIQIAGDSKALLKRKNEKVALLRTDAALSARGRFRMETGENS